jgi:hypothetical protein
MITVYSQTSAVSFSSPELSQLAACPGQAKVLVVSGSIKILGNIKGIANLNPNEYASIVSEQSAAILHPLTIKFTREWPHRTLRTLDRGYD